MMDKKSFGPPLDDDFEDDDDDDFMFDEDNEKDSYLSQPNFSSVTSCVSRFGVPDGHRAADQVSNLEKFSSRSNQRRPTQTTTKQCDGAVVLPLEDVKMAAMQNNISLLKKYIEQGFPVDRPIHSDWTALMYAAYSSKCETVEFLLQEGANANYHQDLYSVLMAACSAKCINEDDTIKCAGSLIKAGADVNAFDRHHVSPIMYAAREGRAKLVRSLVELGADMNKQDSQGYTALLWAVSKKRAHVVYALIELGCDVNKRDRYGSTALDLATINSYKQVEQLLRNKGEASTAKLILSESDLNTADIKCMGDSTAMHYGDLEMVLSGLGLNELIPIFHKHCINLEHFLRMTDSDLQPIVPQAGVRKKLVENIAKLHKKEWESTSVTSSGVLQKQQVTCAEAIFMMQNIKKHVSYIASTTAYIREHMGARVLSVVQEGAGAEQLLIHNTEAYTNAQLLVMELNNLNSHLRTMTTQPNAQPPDLIRHDTIKQETSLGRRVALCSASAMLVGLVLYNRSSVISRLSSFSVRN